MKHDENKDVQLLSKVAKINRSTHTIIIGPNINIGNKRWGRIDFLTHYCGYHLIKQDGTIMSNSPTAEKRRKEKEEKREDKKRKHKAQKGTK